MICEGLVGLVGLVNAMSLPGYASVGKKPPWFECLFLTQTKGGTHGFDKFWDFFVDSPMSGSQGQGNLPTQKDALFRGRYLEGI